MPQSHSSSVYLAAPSLGSLRNVVEYNFLSNLMDANWNATTAQFPAWLPDTYASFYRQVLGVQMSVTVMAIYFIFVIGGNHLNQKRGYHRCSWTESRLFQRLALLHNAVLAIFSTVVFAKAVQIIYRGLPDYVNPEYGARMADYLCRVQAPLWTTEGRQDGLWSEFGGLAEIFCLSKYYELLDSAIIFAAGRRLTNLHIFHHAGVIVCACLMWQLASPHALNGQYKEY
ncbi:hypothetical protein N7499_008306 [Penicillium canescens]|uniref:Elongation of fatty acids protein n=1 Tax=Penicillium canescens TaxID=5083 RepID=A0AAD6N245_PENCN|nr:uncharacterized protein N7446_013341 [Penicillium canescens]KAJ6022988.1 hypothetical protein N7460_013383 [Penicillium canescens]KAJ6042275.1 hypothetical protein N7446_013341 [Penicillium canescens]KAJ6076325.1 hypothetical protein N7499_008306 [Penicillium canescens]KAJ6158637.1 hypothetical protein N7485_011463 [Penicillium canescens]